MDHVSALERDFAASIPPYLGADVRPANIDDANLREDLPLISQPDDVYTVSIPLSLPHHTPVRSNQLIHGVPRIQDGRSTPLTGSRISGI